MRERRRTRRTVVDGTLIGTVKKIVPARIVDISPAGALVEVAAALRPLATCDVSVPLHDGVVRLRATVQRCRVLGPGRLPGGDETMLFRAGLEFGEVSDEDSVRLTALWGGPGPHPVDAPIGADGRGPGREVQLRVDADALRKFG